MTESFLNKIRRTIYESHLIDKRYKVIVGLSGGADSVALLGALLDLGYDCIVAHCNFHLRGDESMRDESFCENLSAKVGVRFMKKDFDVMERCRKYGESVEMACRALRYEWWKSLVDCGVGDLIAVGHHREDNVETFFLNLLRGTSLIGLKAMLPKSGDVVRPLLDCTKKEILDYIADKGFKYVTDSTNLENIYKRNKLRNVVLPILEKEFPGAMESIGKSIKHLRDNHSLYSLYVDELKVKYICDDGSIDLDLILANERNPRMVLFEILSKIGMNMCQVENILETISRPGSNSVSGKIFKSTDIVYLLDRGRLIPVDDSNDVNAIDDLRVDLRSEPFICKEMDVSEFIDLKKHKKLRPDAIYLDSVVLDGDPEFILRGWVRGDRMRPFGMEKGSKLLSDIFSDAKLSLKQKGHTRVLLRNSDIIWVPGIRCSNLFRISSNTQKVLEIILDDGKGKRI